MRTAVTNLLFLSLVCGFFRSSAQPVNFVDCYVGTLASGYTSGGTSLSITSATSTSPCTAVLPNGASFYYALIKQESTNTEEVVLVTNRSGTTLTIVGAQAHRNASNHSSGATVIASIMTASAFSELMLDTLAPATIDHTTGDFVTPGVVTAGSGSGGAGAHEFKCGAPPIFSQPYTFSIYADLCGSTPWTAYQWLMPAGDPGAGAIVSDGGATPSKISAIPLQGSGSKIATASGTTTTDDCVKYNASGALVDSGLSCGGGGGGTGIPQSGWSIVNCGSNCSYDDFSSSIQSFTVWDSGTLNWRLVTRSLPSSTSYTVIAQMRCGHASGTSSQSCGLYISDGTKLEGLELLSQSSAQSQVRVEKMNSVTSDNSTAAGPTAKLTGDLTAFKIVGDATHRTFYYWSAGAWVQVFQEAIGTFLTETTVGFGGVSVASSSGVFINAELLSWSLTNP